jgi:alpha-1,2-glucosyltransferase
MCASLPPLADEPHHIAQIRFLMRGEWRLVPSLTTVPGYHALIAGLGALVGKSDLPSLRLYSLTLSIVALAALFILARDAGDGRPVERLLQIAFLPILFPLFFLVYTDVVALLFFALALLLQERRRYWLAAAAATATLAIRQNYIVWFGLAALLLTLEVVRGHVAAGTMAPARVPATARPFLNRKTVAELATQGAGHGIGLALFAAFVIWNRGIAIGDRAMHPFPSVHFGNIYFALFLTFFLLLPLHVANARRIAEVARRPATILALVGLLVLFLATFRTDHPYNQPELRWWLHNALLTFLASSAWTKLAMFAPMALALLSLCVTLLREPTHYLLYPFAVLSLLLAWQIEQRYYLAPLTLFLLFRVQRSLLFEWSLIAYLVTFTGILFLGISSGAYFL